MSKRQIQRYRAKVEELIQYGGSRNEMVLRKAFLELLDSYARGKNLVLIPELDFVTKRGYTVYPDGTLKDALRQNRGFWESKDEKDNLEDEIENKFAKGYPKSNILFEDTQRAILYQDDEFVMEAYFTNDTDLDEILRLFVNYEPKEVKEFHKAIKLFSNDVPNLAHSLREIIDEQFNNNPQFKKELGDFLQLCKRAISENVIMNDVREMVIQHILTEDVFMRVFEDLEFHKENIISAHLQKIVDTFYTGTSKRNIYSRIEPYYAAINAKASQITNHHEKQKFLKVLYESFYRAYNPKAADRLGVIYTPDEIVQFMVESTDFLLNKHYGKTLGEKNIEILDPATGTGTFITEIIEYLPIEELKYKYEHEIWCNEIAILPYYIANLNIEHTYKQKVGSFKEFENICFVDTLDNLEGFPGEGTQPELFGLWDENAERINKQNKKDISIIIANPPYNARQMNYSFQNANRPYPYIDKRIKDTYVKEGTAQNQNSVYDMYTRFIRWSSDRIRDNGIISFISNNSFLTAQAFDGFRKVVEKEFNEIYVINLKGDAHSSGKERRKQAGNIFHNQIRVGVAIYFFLRKKGQKGCKIYLAEVDDYAKADEKLDFVSKNKLSDLSFKKIEPDRFNNWINQPNEKFFDLVPLAGEEKSIFELTSNGVKTQRDDWVYDFSKEALVEKVEYFLGVYNSTVNNPNLPQKYFIKWDSDLESYCERKIIKNFQEENIVISSYRPFVKMYLYFDKHLNGRTYQWFNFYDKRNLNPIISINVGSTKFASIATEDVVQLGTLLVGGGSTKCFPLYRKTRKGEIVNNIKDWALTKFISNYNNSEITKEDIFNYVYAVLNNPNYINKYKKELAGYEARIPLYKEFNKWVNFGKELMDLHIHYENSKPYPMTRVDENPDNIRRAVKPILIAREESSCIEIDTLTKLTNIPNDAWKYKVGTYSAMEWILDRYKERTSRYETINEKFDTYRFADHKEQVIDLLMRVCNVSVETVRIMNEMEATGEA